MNPKELRETMTVGRTPTTLSDQTEPLTWLFPGRSQGSLSPWSQDGTHQSDPSVNQWEVIMAFGDVGVRNVRKSLLQLCKIYCGMFRGRIKGEEREGSKRAGEEQARENNGKREKKGSVMSIVGWPALLFWPFPRPDHHSLSCLLITIHF